MKKLSVVVCGLAAAFLFANCSPQNRVPAPGGPGNPPAGDLSGKVQAGKSDSCGEAGKDVCLSVTINGKEHQFKIDSASGAVSQVDGQEFGAAPGTHATCTDPNHDNSKGALEDCQSFSFLLRGPDETGKTAQLEVRHLFVMANQTSISGLPDGVDATVNYYRTDTIGARKTTDHVFVINRSESNQSAEFDQKFSNGVHAIIHGVLTDKELSDKWQIVYVNSGSSLDESDPSKVVLILNLAKQSPDGSQMVPMKLEVDVMLPQPKPVPAPPPAPAAPAAPPAPATPPASQAPAAPVPTTPAGPAPEAPVPPAEPAKNEQPPAPPPAAAPEQPAQASAPAPAQAAPVAPPADDQKQK